MGADAEPLRMWLRWNGLCEAVNDAITLGKRGFLMKKLSFAIVGAAALALAACGGKGDDALGDNIEDNYDAAADNLEAMADNTANGAEAAALENQADALEAEGDAKEEAVDEADVNAAAVNAM
jgi:hypothetical protein